MRLRKRPAPESLTERVSSRLRTEKTNTTAESERSEDAIALLKTRGAKVVLNIYCCCPFDDVKGILYLVGGSDPDDEEYNFSPSLVTYNVSTNRWEDHTNQVTQIPNPHPLSSARTYRARPTRPQPHLFNAAFSILRNNNRRIMMTFGGHRDTKTSEYLSASFSAIDLDNFNWWPVTVRGGTTYPREGACMVIVGERMYLFGGILAESETHSFRFSVLRLDRTSAYTSWDWEIHDQAFPSEITRSDWHRLNALAVDNNQKILIVGSVKPQSENGHTVVTSDRMFLFDTTDNSFQSLAMSSGDFPTSDNGFELNYLGRLLESTPSNTQTQAILMTGYSQKGECPTPTHWRYDLMPVGKWSRIAVTDKINKFRLKQPLTFTCGRYGYVLGRTPNKSNKVALVKFPLPTGL